MKPALRVIAIVPAATLIALCVASISRVVASAPQPSQALAIQYMLDRGEFARAESAAEAFLLEAKSVQPPDLSAFQRATVLLVEARCRNGHGVMDDTRVLAETALSAIVASVGADDARIIPSVKSLGEVMLQAGAYAAAVQNLNRALALAEGADGDASTIAGILIPLSTSLLWADRWKDAVSTAQRAVTLLDVSGADQVRLGRALVAQGEILQIDGQLPAAHAALARAVKAFDAGNASPPEQAHALSLFGEQYSYESDPMLAHEYLTRSLELARSALRPGHPELARYMRRLAASTYELGEAPRARELREQAVRIAETGLGSSHPQVGLLINDYALSLLQDEDYVGALREYSRALEIFEKLGPRSATTTLASYNLGVTLVELGDSARARPYLTRALENWRHLTGPDSTYTAYGLFGLASLLGAEGKTEEQLAALEQALAIRRKQLGNDSLTVARSLTHLSRALLRAGDAGSAAARATESVGIWVRVQAIASPGYADALSARAEAEQRQGNERAAAVSYREAIGALEKAFGPTHPDVAYAKTSLALALEASGLQQEAFRVVLEAEAIERDHVTAVVRYLPERQALGYVKQSVGYLSRNSLTLDVALSLAERSPRSAGIAFDRVIRSRSLIVDEVARRHQTAGDDSTEARALRAELVELKQRLANLLIRGPGAQGLEQYLTTTRELKDKSERAERALAERSVGFEDETLRRNTGLIDVQRALPDGTALVSIYRYERLRTSPPDTVVASRQSRNARPDVVPSYMAFVLRSNSLDPLLVPLGDAQLTDDLVRRWRSAIMAGTGPSSVRSELRLRELGVALRRRVWDPLVPQLKGTNRVFIVPDGALNLVAFSALPTGTTGYLLESGPTLHYLSSERDLAGWKSLGQGTRSLLAMGNPSFNDSTMFASGAPSTAPLAPSTAFRGSTSACPGFQTMNFDGLPSSGNEARDVAAIWAQFGNNSDAPTVLTESAADERSFKQLGPGSRVLHLATHGFFLGGDCASALDGARSVGGLVSRKQPATLKRPAAPSPKAPSVSAVTGENPLLLSGLALAGANRRASATGDEEDGILTAEEVASMNLVGVEWAVLSACDTGLGEIRAGEGVLGLRRAFQVAGAHTVIMSLWAVADRSAVDWMRALYEGRLARKLDTAAAVREASLTVLRQRRAKGQSTHPFYWAGFVASGDWR